MPTLKITVGERDNLDQCTRYRLQAAQEGEDLGDAQPHLSFASYTELSELISTQTLQLLEAISEHDPENIRSAAKLVDRDYKQVHQTLSELETIGVVELEDRGSSEQAKKPKLLYDGVKISIQFTDSDGSTDSAKS